MFLNLFYFTACFLSISITVCLFESLLQTLLLPKPNSKKIFKTGLTTLHFIQSKHSTIKIRKLITAFVCIAQLTSDFHTSVYSKGGNAAVALTEITSSYAKKPKPVLLETRTCEFYKTQCKWSFPTFMHGHVFVLMLLTPNQLPPSIIVGTRGELNSQLWNVTGKLTESKADICKSWASFVMRIRSLPRLVLSVSFSFWAGEGHFFLFCLLGGGGG